MDIIAAMEEEFQQAENDMKTEFQNQRDEIKSKNAEEFGFLSLKLDGRIEQMEKEFDQANHLYTTTTVILFCCVLTGYRNRIFPD